ncbi:MAG: GNAT family N-acetyltransferase [Nitrososphaerota archaeon]
MSRKNFVLTPPYREIILEDATKQFHNEKLPQEGVLAELVTMNTGNRHVFVFDQDNEIKAFLMFEDCETYFHVELLFANRLSEPQSAGTNLIKLLADLGKKLNYDRIELWSYEKKISYYLGLGYVDTGIPQVVDNDKMFKMVKSLH